MEVPYHILGQDRHTVTILVDGVPDGLTSDHVARAPTPAGKKDASSMLHGSQEAAVPLDYKDWGTKFVWKRCVGWDRETDEDLWLLVRWWGYAPKKATWKPWYKVDREKVVPFCQGVGTEPPLLDEQILALLQPLRAFFCGTVPWGRDPGMAQGYIDGPTVERSLTEGQCSGRRGYVMGPTVDAPFFLTGFNMCPAVPWSLSCSSRL